MYTVKDSRFRISGTSILRLDHAQSGRTNKNHFAAAGDPVAKCPQRQASLLRPTSLTSSSFHLHVAPSGQLAYVSSVLPKFCDT
jgi:hypothetical protein